MLQSTRGESGSWVSEIGMIDGVDELGAELQAHAFMEREVFYKPQKNLRGLSTRNVSISFLLNPDFESAGTASVIM